MVSQVLRPLTFRPPGRLPSLGSLPRSAEELSGHVAFCAERKINTCSLGSGRGLRGGAGGGPGGTGRAEPPLWAAANPLRVSAPRVSLLLDRAARRPWAGPRSCLRLPPLDLCLGERLLRSRLYRDRPISVQVSACFDRACTEIPVPIPPFITHLRPPRQPPRCPDGLVIGDPREFWAFAPPPRRPAAPDPAPGPGPSHDLGNPFQELTRHPSGSTRAGSCWPSRTWAGHLRALSS